jgi:tRNA (guanine37-N1)-methyltransferase
MKKNLKYYLNGKLTKRQLKLVPCSFDVVGCIMIFSDFPDALSKKEKIIGEVILKNYSNINTILKKTKEYSGKFRTPKLKFIAGVKTKETVHRENDILIKLNVEKVYFSPRTSGERKRIAKKVKANEKVMVMFSGCAPYPLVIGKLSKGASIYGVEINPIAHKFALENLKTNKMEDIIHLYIGDASKIIPKLNKKYDRIIMPLPKTAGKYLELALKYIKKNGIIHFYDFQHETELKKSKDKIKFACNVSSKKCRIMKIIKCGQYSPGFNRVCTDFKVL